MTMLYKRRPNSRDWSYNKAQGGHPAGWEWHGTYGVRIDAEREAYRLRQQGWETDVL